MGTNTESVTLPTRELGQFGPFITEVGFGAWAIRKRWWAVQFARFL
jgi:hypothetical protein